MVDAPDDNDRTVKYTLAITFDDATIAQLTPNDLMQAHIAVIANTAKNLVGYDVSIDDILAGLRGDTFGGVQNSWWMGNVRVDDRLVSYRWGPLFEDNLRS
jgi:hypothetical protein